MKINPDTGTLVPMIRRASVISTLSIVILGSSSVPSFSQDAALIEYNRHILECAILLWTDPERHLIECGVGPEVIFNEDDDDDDHNDRRRTSNTPMPSPDDDDDDHDDHDWHHGRDGHHGKWHKNGNDHVVTFRHRPDIRVRVGKRIFDMN